MWSDVPEDEQLLPPCWNTDEVRMNALFAPFRLKAANPESWEMKMKFWSNRIRALCRSRGDPVVSAANVKASFHRNGRTPACIEIVVEEMYRNGDLVPLSKYQQILQNGPEGWVKWGARLAFKPAAFALGAVTSMLPTRYAVDNDGLPKASIDSTQKFVLESFLKEQAAKLLETYPAGLERVGTIDQMMARVEWKAGRDVFELVLGCLVLQGKALLHGDVVKFAEPNSKVSPITEQDTALVKLTCAESRLEGDATRLSRDETQAESDARVALSLGNRVAAKNHLRRKHKAGARLERCTAALDNVKQLLSHMRDVSHNLAIVDTYKTAAEAMKTNMKENNLDDDTVHDTMDDLKEVMETYNEIEKTLAGPPVEDDTADLEAELKELLSMPENWDGGKSTEIGKDTTWQKYKTARKISEREFVFDGEERILAELNELGIEDSSPGDRAGKVPGRVPVAVPAAASATEWTKETGAEKPKPSKSWYPPSSEWNNNFAEIRQDDRIHPGQQLNIDYSTPPRHYGQDFQVRDHKLDGGVWLFSRRTAADRAPAGQAADEDREGTAHLDKRRADSFRGMDPVPGRCSFNRAGSTNLERDGNANLDELLGTEYLSSESPGKTGSNFQMAPGGERKKEVESQPDVANQQPESNRPGPGSNQPDTDSNQPDLDLYRRLRQLRGFKS